MKVEYEPFGEEWELQMMKFPKKVLIDLYRKVCIKQQENDRLDPLVVPNEAVAGELEHLLENIPHNIPFYAYGDNEAACQMDTKLQWIYVELNAIVEKLKQ